LKLGYHAPAVDELDFFPMLVLDAVLTGAKGLNLWASFQTPPSQRSARLYRTVVDARLASSVMGALVPTAEPFLYTISVTATEGTPLAQLEEAVLAEIDRVRSDGVTEVELARAARQLRARLVFENDSITNIGHQLGYFETVANWQMTETLAGRIGAVTREQVDAAAAARLTPDNRTVAWLEPSIDATSSQAAASGR
jgi:zinc protease